MGKCTARHPFLDVQIPTKGAELNVPKRYNTRLTRSGSGSLSPSTAISGRWMRMTMIIVQSGGTGC